jgi:tRNA(Arg) A34 adenosine deaminase TadA
MTQAELMQEAVHLAVANVQAGQGGPFAALVVRDGEIVAGGTNLVTSTNDPTAHAEIVAIREAGRVLGDFNLAGCELYTTCEPCPMCMGAIYWARLDRVFYGATREDAAQAGFDDEFIYRELCRAIHERTLPFKELQRAVALEPFKIWARKEGRVAY